MKATPSSVPTPNGEDAPKAPWLQPPGICPSCDRRRAVGAAEAKRQREKKRAADAAPQQE